MRKLLFAAAALALAAPAAAQPPAYDPAEDRDIAEALPDRHEIGRMARAMEGMVAALLDVPIGPIVAAVDPMARGRYSRHNRLRDLSDDPHVEQRLRESVRGTAAGMGAMIEAVAAATPALRRSLEDVSRRIEQAIGEARYGE